ncbi:MAG: molybdopterin dinucleotide binding domain-containing protein, partial [Oceanococcaceae bacterium]
MHNYQRLVKGKDRCLLLMHPEDMQRQGLSDLQAVRIESRVGSLQATVQALSGTKPLRQWLTAVSDGVASLTAVDDD